MKELCFLTSFWPRKPFKVVYARFACGMSDVIGLVLIIGIGIGPIMTWNNRKSVISDCGMIGQSLFPFSFLFFSFLSFPFLIFSFIFFFFSSLLFSFLFFFSFSFLLFHFLFSFLSFSFLFFSSLFSSSPLFSFLFFLFLFFAFLFFSTCKPNRFNFISLLTITCIVHLELEIFLAVSSGLCYVTGGFESVD